MWLYSCILIQVLYAIAQCIEDQSPVINTPTGRISGTVQYFEGMPTYAFLGIPYAKPPLGQLRFKLPVSIEPGTEVYQAHKLPPGCIQCPGVDYPGVDPGPDLSEDCLYLNVWVPSNASITNKKSVIFFLHGGGYISGSTRLDTFNGAPMAALGDVIVVTTNYRLGPQGFLYSKTNDAPGNMGLYDMLEALKFVRNNIETFGGDKNNITIFGQSVGAISVSMFMASPLFKGLFKRVILDSGASTELDVENNHLIYRVSETLVKDVGCLSPGESLKDHGEAGINCLRKIDGMELCNIAGDISESLNYGLYPHTGDAMVPDNNRKLYAEGKYEAYDMFIGDNRDEGSDKVVEMYPEIFGFFGEQYPKMNLTFAREIIIKFFTPYSKYLFPEEIADHYLKDLDSSDNSTTIFYVVQKALGDFERFCPTVYLAEFISERRKPVYFYKFNHYSSNSRFAPYMGVVHWEELPYVFGYPLRYPQNYTQNEIDLGRQMLDTWTGFARTGAPPDPTWPLYNKSSHLYLELNANRPWISKVGPHLENCNFFRPIFGFSK